MKVYIQKLGTGIPFVFLHGWGFDSNIWLPIANKLTERFSLYLVDLPGFGQTPNMSWDNFKNSLLEQLPGEFILIGWSLGGLFATKLTIEEPKLVKRLINVTTSPRFIVDDNWAGIKQEAFADFYDKFLLNAKIARDKFMRTQLKSIQLPKDIISIKDPTHIGLQYGLDILINWDLRDDLEKITVPVLYIFGNLDSIVPKLTFNIMREKYPMFKYVLFKKSAHMPFLSHPDEFIELITLDFMTF